VVVVVLLRQISLRFDIKTPAEVDFTPTVAAAGRRMASDVKEAASNAIKKDEK
jgi:hypothetical protein